MFHYFLRRTGYIFLKLYWDLLGLSSMITSTKNFFHECHSPQLWWEEGILGQILPIFVCQCFMFFFYLLRIIQYFLTKFFTVVFGISLRITTLKIFFASCPPSAGHHFGIFLGLFWQIVLDICQVFSHGLLGRCCWCSSEGHCTIFLIWRNISLILSNCSIFSHETLFTCSWYNPDHH